MSAVLVKHNWTDRHSMYYVSYLFKGAKLRCIGLEKMTLGLDLLTQCLRPYFLLHLIMVMTDTPLMHIWTNLKEIGRLIKLAMELSEYGIEYQP